MLRVHPLLVICLGISMLSGCVLMENIRQQTGANGQAEVETRQDSALAGLVHYAQSIRTLSDDVLKQEHQRITNRVKYMNEVSNERIKLALLLSLPSAPFRDDQQAERILTDYLLNDTGGLQELRDFINLQLNVIGERQKLVHTLQTTKDELALERKEVKTLQEQLEALKAIEKSIDERDEAVVVPKDKQE